MILERREAHKVSPRIDLILYRDIWQFPSTVQWSIVSAEHCGPSQIRRHGSQLKVGELLESAEQNVREGRGTKKVPRILWRLGEGAGKVPLLSSEAKARLCMRGKLYEGCPGKYTWTDPLPNPKIMLQHSLIPKWINEKSIKYLENVQMTGS